MRAQETEKAPGLGEIKSMVNFSPGQEKIKKKQLSGKPKVKG